VQESNHVKQEEKGKQPPGDPILRALCDRRVQHWFGHLPSVRKHSEFGGAILHYFGFFAA
ncbi:MAG: hypothetical protein WBE12_19110, partial [Candidatus Acidiferrum sp.]